MHILVRAVITGFGLALGAALYKKVAKEFGLDEAAPATATAATGDGSGEPATST